MKVLPALPTEVIGGILSLLPLKEAARTSVVCKEWRALWSNYFSGSVTMEPPWVSCHIYYTLDEETSAWMSKVVRDLDRLLFEDLKSPFLKEFKVICALNYPCFEPVIDLWIDVVTSKQLETLDLNFLEPPMRSSPPWKYTLSWPEQCHSLKVLRLRFICVSGETLEQLLSCCPFLEELNVSRSPKLAGLKVWHENLKHLEIYECGSIEHLTVESAPNLAYLKFTTLGRLGALLSLVNVPCLTNVFLGSTNGIHASDAEGRELDLIHQVHHSVALHLKELTLDLSHHAMPWRRFFCNEERTQTLLDNLAHLNLILPLHSLPQNSRSMVSCDISELEKMASPAFRKFVPKLEWREVCLTERFLSDTDASMNEVIVKKWIFDNTNGGLFTIAWCDLDHIKGVQGRLAKPQVIPLRYEP